MSTNSKPIQKFLAVILLLSISTMGFYACKKQPAETLDPNAKYKGELKTYHESQDYKNLLNQYPDGNFVDQPIFDANSKMKTIVTNIISNSGEIVKAMTYFEPEGDFNTWYPTIIIQMKAQVGNDLKAMIEAKKFSGSFEFKTTDNVRMNLVQVVNNEEANQPKAFEPLKKSTGSLGNSKLMVVDESGGGLMECLKAADVCAKIA